MNHPIGEMRYGTLTTSASGTRGDEGVLFPARCNQPFKNLSIVVIPVDDPSPYKVDVWFNDQLVETHDYPDPAGYFVAQIGFPNFVFPANLSLESIPVFTPPGLAPPTMDIAVVVTNYAAAEMVFAVYTCFEVFDTPRFGIVQQE